MHNHRYQYLIFFLAAMMISSIDASVIKKRNLAEDIRTGINLAGKILGFDAASNVADLIARAFVNTNSAQNSNSHPYDDNDKRDQYANLETFVDDSEATLPTDNDASADIDDNEVIRPSNIHQTNIGDTPIISGLLKVLGMDNSKIGALAINGIIFIAQMIGRSLVSTFGGITPPATHARHTPEAEPLMKNPFDYIAEKRMTSNELANQMEALQHRDLTERIVRSIEEQNIRNETNTDCIKLLLCKSAPFVWGMQRTIATQVEEKPSDDENNDADVNDDTNDIRSWGIDKFFECLPTLEEFKNHSNDCNAQYKSCTIYTLTP